MNEEAATTSTNISHTESTAIDNRPPSTQSTQDRLSHSMFAPAIPDAVDQGRASSAFRGPPPHHERPYQFSKEYMNELGGSHLVTPYKSDFSSLSPPTIGSSSTPPSSASRALDPIPSRSGSPPPPPQTTFSMARSPVSAPSSAVRSSSRSLKHIVPPLVVPTDAAVNSGHTNTSVAELDPQSKAIDSSSRHSVAEAIPTKPYAKQAPFSHRSVHTSRSPPLSSPPSSSPSTVVVIHSPVIYRRVCGMNLTSQLVCVALVAGLMMGYNMSTLNPSLPIIAAEFGWCQPGYKTGLPFSSWGDGLWASSGIPHTALIWMCDFDKGLKGMANSAVILGAAIGSISSSSMAALGRRSALLFIFGLFILGALLAVTSHGLSHLVLGRLITGIASGAATVIPTLYISEMSNPKDRGFYGLLPPLAISTGVFIGVCIGLPLVVPIAATSGNASVVISAAEWSFDKLWWRIMISLPVFPSLIAGLVLFYIFPFETPFYLSSVARSPNEARTIAALLLSNSTSMVSAPGRGSSSTQSATTIGSSRGSRGGGEGIMTSSNSGERISRHGATTAGHLLVKSGTLTARLSPLASKPAGHSVPITTSIKLPESSRSSVGYKPLVAERKSHSDSQKAEGADVDEGYETDEDRSGLGRAHGRHHSHHRHYQHIQTAGLPKSESGSRNLGIAGPSRSSKEQDSDGDDDDTEHDVSWHRDENNSSGGRGSRLKGSSSVHFQGVGSVRSLTDTKEHLERAYNSSPLFEESSRWDGQEIEMSLRAGGQSDDEEGWAAAAVTSSSASSGDFNSPPNRSVSRGVMVGQGGHPAVEEGLAGPGGGGATARAPKLSFGRALQIPSYRRVVFVGWALSVLQQVVGMAVFVAASNDLFAQAGVPEDKLTLTSAGMMGLGLIMTLLASLKLSEFRRRKVFLLGSAFMSAALAPAVLCGNIEALGAYRRGACILSTLLFVIAFSLSLGPGMFLYLDELFPSTIKDAAMGSSFALNWISSFLVVSLSARLNQNQAYSFFFAMCILTLAFVHQFVLETKDATGENSLYFVGAHGVSRRLDGKIGDSAEEDDNLGEKRRSSRKSRSGGEYRHLKTENTDKAAGPSLELSIMTS